MDSKDGRAHRAARRAQRSFLAQANNVNTNDTTDQLNGTSDSPVEEDIDEDDLCPICQLLLHEPVTTTCKHTLCNFCMATWASTSLAAPMTIVDVDEQPVHFDPVSVEARCPMCRTLTSAVADGPRAEDLRTKYPLLCRQRDLEAAAEQGPDSSASLQTLTVYIGNRHSVVPARANDLAQNQHEWTFFVRPSRTDIIEEVHVHLHPTFRQNHVVKRRAPYEVSRLGWGHFVINATVVLKNGWTWVSEDAFDAPEDGARKGALPLEWTLDFEGFEGRGSMGRCRLKVRDERSERSSGRRRRVVGQVG